MKREAGTDPEEAMNSSSLKQRHRSEVVYFLKENETYESDENNGWREF